MNATHQLTHAVTRTIVALLCHSLFATSVVAQPSEIFGDRLSVLPVDLVTYRSLSGSGEVQATLTNRTLDVVGSFQGLSSAATVAHIHQAPMARRGPSLVTLEVTQATDGRISGAVQLNDTQIETLRDGGLYVQIHTQTNADGEIRGWLLPTEPRISERVDPTPATFSSAQARRGAHAYQDVCASCHQVDLSGAFEAPELAGSSFASLWAGRPARGLFQYIRAAMPPAGRKPHDDTLLDIVAFILRTNGMTAGADPFVPDDGGIISHETRGRP